MKVDRRKLVLLPLLAVAGSAVRFGGALMPTEALAQDEPAATDSVPGADVTGFRSAKFGMGESDVRAAISNDFGAGDDAVRVVPNELDGTTVLSVDVHDLIPATGVARVNYVLGYSSLALTRVNIVWGTPVHPEATADDMTKVAVLLQRYFDGLGLVPESIIRQKRLPNGTVILFGGADAAGHAVAVIYREGEVKNEDGSTRKVFLLRLSYVSNPQDPDIYKLDPGSF